MLIGLNIDVAQTATTTAYRQAVAAARARVLPRVRQLTSEWVATLEYDAHNNAAIVRVLTQEPVPRSCREALRRLPGVAWLLDD